MREILIACHACDLVHKITTIPQGGAAYCSRCGTVLYRPRRDSINRSLALTLAGSIFYLIANTYPFLGFKIGAHTQETTLITGIVQLYLQDMYIIAALVFLTVVLIPAIHLLTLLYILLPLQRNKKLHFPAPVLRLHLALRPWAMLEIFFLGILVSVVKLVKMATIIPGPALYAFFALIFTFSALSVTLDAHLLWEKIKQS